MRTLNASNCEYRDDWRLETCNWRSQYCNIFQEPNNLSRDKWLCFDIRRQKQSHRYINQKCLLKVNLSRLSCTLEILFILSITFTWSYWIEKCTTSGCRPHGRCIIQVEKTEEYNNDNDKERFGFSVVDP